MGIKKNMLIGLIFVCSTILLGNEENFKMLEIIDLEYQELKQKENVKIDEFKAEKIKLEKELEVLKERQIGKEKNYEKLKKDSEIRWHRDEYKKLLKKYDEYHRKINIAIEERELKIMELEKLLNIIEK